MIVEINNLIQKVPVWLLTSDVPVHHAMQIVLKVTKRYNVYLMPEKSQQTFPLKILQRNSIFFLPSFYTMLNTKFKICVFPFILNFSTLIFLHVCEMKSSLKW